MTTAGSDGNRPVTATATRTERRDDDDDGAAVVAADGAEATAKAARARPASNQTVTAASRNGIAAKDPPDLRTRIPTTMSRCRSATAGGPPRGRRAMQAGRRRPVRRVASLRARPALTTVNRANPAGDADADADVVRDAVATPAAPQHRPRAVASHRVVRVREAAAVAAVGAGAQAMSGVRHRPSIVVAATNSPRWREVARKTTRGWNSSVSRMQATIAMAATTGIRWTTTASSRAASTRCSTCRAGWRRSASSSPAISTPAVDRRGATTDGVADADGCRHGPAVRLQAVRLQAVRYQLVQAEVT